MGVLMKTTITALGVILTLGMASAAEAGAVLDFNDLAQPGTGRNYIRPNNFKYEGFNFYSTWSLDPNFFTLGTDDAANADPEGTTFSHNYDFAEVNITRADNSLFDLFSIDLADKFNIGANHAGRFRFVYADNRQEELLFNTDSNVGLETIVLNKTGLKAFLYYADAGVQIDNMALEGSVAAVPEPATWAMMILGFGGVGATLRRRRQILANA
jgi:hypothetical protein